MSEWVKNLNSSDTDSSNEGKDKTARSKKKNDSLKKSGDVLIELSAPKAKGLKPPIVFDGTMTPESCADAIVKVFENNYEDALNDNNVISDFLPVRDMRIIVRVFKLCDSAELFQFRKPALCTMVRSFMSQESMKQKYYIMKEKKENKKAEVPEKQKNKKIPAKMATPVIIHNKVGGDNQLYPNTVTDATRILSFIKKFNKIIWELSTRLTELERTVSVLLVRINEAELLYNESPKEQ